MSNSFNGLSTSSEDVATILNTEDIEVFFKLYLLLYADDTVIFTESPEELQITIDTMQSYCDKWKLQINTSKSKIVYFFFKRKKTKQNPVVFLL